ncbi:cytochrome C biogenesis protein [Schleiferia thermophila str. Yellowstone]|mgnify:CR=1 FL=1|jgi:thiol-disulfide isomerase/thioredoxin|nr:cytochrome C biogenesis protein [Schleiferia thermophila str. Yellowstone]
MSKFHTFVKINLKVKKIKVLFLTAFLSFASLAFLSYKQKLQSVGLSVGDVAPELAFPNPEGKIIKLSDYRGKIVLIDFWASWCRPCRMENPNLVKLYKNYNDVKFGKANGFEIFSVSLDQNKADWVNAIKADGLLWTGHVSDLKFWKSEAARIYNVNSIPMTYLIDEKGVIIARGLRGQALERALEGLRNNQR